MRRMTHFQNLTQRTTNPSHYLTLSKYHALHPSTYLRSASTNILAVEGCVLLEANCIPFWLMWLHLQPQRRQRTCLALYLIQPVKKIVHHGLIEASITIVLQTASFCEPICLQASLVHSVRHLFELVCCSQLRLLKQWNIPLS